MTSFLFVLGLIVVVVAAILINRARGSAPAEVVVPQPPVAPKVAAPKKARKTATRKASK